MYLIKGKTIQEHMHSGYRKVPKVKEKVWRDGFLPKNVVQAVNKLGLPEYKTQRAYHMLHDFIFNEPQSDLSSILKNKIEEFV